MKLIIIGASGHWNIAVDAAARDSSVSIGAVAPGCPDEDISGLCAAVPAATVYNSWREMLQNETADVAIVNPWFALAAEVTVECLNRGMDVYSEKPLATTHEQLSRVESAWRASGRALGGMFNYRFYPWFMAMENAVNAGLVGQVRQIHGQKSYRMGNRAPFYKKRELMGGLIPWVAIHAIDWVAAFGGRCRWVSASHSSAENRGHGDMEVTSATLMGLENGVIGTVTADFLRPTGSARHDDDRLRITGTRGMVEVIDGRVYLENENSRRELELPEMQNSFLAFMQAVSAGKGDEFTLAALHATKIALCARDSADADGVRQEI
jgi:predicted dehydrogenase